MTLIPPSWYVLCGSSRLRGRLQPRRLGTHDLLAYRSPDGRPVVLDAHCAHMGPSMARGCVVGDRLRCPYHQWEFGPDGVCRNIPAVPIIPPHARISSHPAVDRCGRVFFHFVHDATTSATEFPDFSADAVRPLRPLRMQVVADPVTLAATLPPLPDVPASWQGLDCAPAWRRFGSLAFEYRVHTGPDSIRWLALVEPLTWTRCLVDITILLPRRSGVLSRLLAPWIEWRERARARAFVHRWRSTVAETAAVREPGRE